MVSCLALAALLVPAPGPVRAGATVSSAGTIAQSGIAVETDVTISVVPPPPDASTDEGATVAASSFAGSPIAYLALVTLGLLALGAAARRRSD